MLNANGQIYETLRKYSQRDFRGLPERGRDHGSSLENLSPSVAHVRPPGVNDQMGSCVVKEGER